MNVNEMQMSDIEKRSAEIEEMMKAEDADIESLTAEVEQLEKRKAEIEKEVEERKKEAEEALKNGKTVEEIGKDEKHKMNIEEIRKSQDYAKAYADWVVSGYKNDKELRKILTANADADNVGENDTTYPVPVMLENKIQTAWERDEIMSRVAPRYLKGNLKIGFEISGTDAVVHAEGSEAPAEEKLVLGSVEIKADSVKKWLFVTTEQYEMGGEEFMDYIYDEIAYRIVKKLAEIAINAIKNSPATSTANAPAVPVLTQALGAGTIASAEGLLTSEATEIVAIMSRATESALKALVISSGNNVGDVFDGLTVLHTDALPDYASATANATYMLVGDMKSIMANFPNGRDIKFIFDDKSKAEEDLVKVVGRVLAGIGYVAPKHFVQVKKA
jgi:HK97 family phage major capsid protein